jgi:hypothetical protein
MQGKLIMKGPMSHSKMPGEFEISTGSGKVAVRLKRTDRTSCVDYYQQTLTTASRR